MSGIRAKLHNQKRFKEKIAMKKTIAAHEEKDVRIAALLPAMRASTRAESGYLNIMRLI